MPRIYTQAPYRDNYDASKNYVQQLAIPGRGAQAVEFTRLGTMYLDFLKRLGDTIMRDGNIVEGCSIAIIENDVTIGTGKIYLGGIVRHVEKQSKLTITGVGNEVIGCKLKEEVITEAEDMSLNDPAAGSENYGQPGVHMVKQTVVWTVNDPDSSPVYRLSGGTLVTVNDDKPQMEIVEDLLARRTYDESGNYKVKGLKLMDKGRSDEDHAEFTLTEGKAYVQGFEILKTSASTFRCRKSKTTRIVTGEPKIYTTSSGDTYKLNNHPVASIRRLTATVEVTEDITRGAIAGGIDYLPKTPVVNIVEVKQGGTTYSRGTDFQLVNDGIDWSLLGKEPAIGTKYTVKYYYKKTLVESTDFRLIVNENKSTIQFIGSERPMENAEVQIDYAFYLARKDLISIDKGGNIVIVEGEPDIYRLVSSPPVDNVNMLALGTITMLPNSDKSVIVNNSVERMSMESLQKVVKRVEDLEYNQAITDLDQEAAAGEPATQLKGVLTDNFAGFTKCDTAHTQFNMALDISRNELTLPAISKTNTLSPNKDSFETITGQIGTVITAPFKSVVALSQQYATEAFLINPYQVFDRMLPVKLIPSIDNWIEEETVVVEGNKVNTTSLRRWWYHKGEPWAEEERRKWEALGFKDGGESLEWADGHTTNSNSTSEVILDEAIPYMRKREVEVKAYNFPFNCDNIEGYFDDIKVTLVPMSPSTPGTAVGTVRADGKGNVRCKFTIPDKIPCGTKKFELRSPSIKGSAEYTANGRHRVIQQTIIKEEVIVKPTDPLAQTFQFDEDTTLTGVDLYFAVKDDHPVSVQVRNVVNGYPGPISYGEFVVTPDQIQTSPDASLSTHIEFDSPVMAKADTQYCFVVLTDSSVASVYVCNLGDRDLTTGTYVTTQPYVGGVMFSSSNGLTWSAHQSKDIKFKLYKAQYQGKGSVVFQNIAVSQADRIMLAIDALSPKDTGIIWYFSVNDGAWQTIDLWDDRDTSIIANKIALKAEIDAKDSTSPMIALETIQLVTFLNQGQGRYISRNVHLDEGFNHIKVIIDMCIPTGTTAKIYYATDVAGDVWTELTDPKVLPVDAEFVKYEYNKQLDSKVKDYRVKVEFKTNNPLARPRGRKLLNILKTV